MQIGAGKVVRESHLYLRRQGIEPTELKGLVVEASAGVTGAAQAHTVLAQAVTRFIPAPQPLRMLERAAVLIAFVESHEQESRYSMLETNRNWVAHIDISCR